VADACERFTEPFSNSVMLPLVATLAQQPQPQQQQQQQQQPFMLMMSA
jgi:hypothetical protein